MSEPTGEMPHESGPNRNEAAIYKRELEELNEQLTRLREIANARRENLLHIQTLISEFPRNKAPDKLRDINKTLTELLAALITQISEFEENKKTFEDQIVTALMPTTEAVLQPQAEYALSIVETTRKALERMRSFEEIVKKSIADEVLAEDEQLQVTLQEIFEFVGLHIEILEQELDVARAWEHSLLVRLRSIIE